MGLPYLRSWEPKICFSVSLRWPDSGCFSSAVSRFLLLVLLMLLLWKLRNHFHSPEQEQQQEQEAGRTLSNTRNRIHSADAAK